MGVGVSYLEWREKKTEEFYPKPFSVLIYSLKEWLGWGCNLQLTGGGHKEKTGCNVGEKDGSIEGF